eukprot:m.419973 g.419973  ORF g.419973 m.419973 type:complete len:150 (-) comp20186_c0_seq22:1379-1828(-)
MTARNHTLETQLQVQRQATAESESQLDAAQARVATLHSQLNRQQEQHHDELQQHLRAQQTGLEEQVQQLTSKLAILEGVKAECHRLKDGNEAYHRQVVRLEEDLAAATKTIADSEERCAGLNVVSGVVVSAWVSLLPAQTATDSANPQA